jgi:endonuclease/exonuclease/phosphatase family metal-dependent hydrolase
MQTAPREQPLRVMTYNIQYGNEGIDSVIAVINAEKPDIVGLQELDVHWSERSKFVNQIELLAKGTGMQYRFAPIYQMPGTDPSKPPREFGVGILSRYPITAFTNHMITRLSTQEENPVPGKKPGFLDAMLDVKGTKVHVYDVHLDYRRDPQVRAMQVADMLQIIGDLKGPTLMFGDMNAHPDAPELAPLFQKFHDTWPASNGPGLTMPAKSPTGKIDFVLMSDGFRVQGARVPQVYASDHFPVVVDLLLTRTLQ